MVCQNCGVSIPENSTACPGCGASVSTALEVSPELPMKWYNFLVRYALWFGGIGIFVLGLVQLLGIPYLMLGTDPMVIYAQYPVLLIADLIYGVCCLGLGALFIITRFRMAAFKATAPMLLYLTYALCVVTPMLYSFVSGRLVGTPAGELIGLVEVCQILGAAAGVALNVVYFKKREHLFYN